jgi:YVTN family beta-propeller protein
MGIYDEKVLGLRPFAAWLALSALAIFSLLAQSFTAPAGVRQALRREGASILPGGRIIAPAGKEYPTGPGPFALALSPSGRSAITANTGPWRYTLTLLTHDRVGQWEGREIDARAPSTLDVFGVPRDEGGDWKGVSNGVAFSGERAFWVSEGNSGRVALYDSTEERRRAIDLNAGGYSDSYTSGLAFDSLRGMLYVADQANSRIGIVDARTRQVLASVRVGRLPFDLALSPDGDKLYVANLGVLQYHMVPNADTSNARTTGLQFPGPFPTGADSPEANSLAVIDVSNPSAPKLQGLVRTGNSPSAVLATAAGVFVANANDDSIAAIDPATRAVTARIDIRIPGFETLRGVLPMGMAYDEKSGWLLVAEAGINAVGVIDVRSKRVLGHVPVAWYPTRVAIAHSEVLVTNARGHGIGPDAPTAFSQRAALLPSSLFQGTVSVFELPKPEDLAAFTQTVMRANGFTPARPAASAPPPVRHVVLIVKEGRAYDEVLGDVARASNGPAMGDSRVARYGISGTADGGRQRFSLKDVKITPNAHALAEHWAFSDNFYSDGEGTVDGHHWLSGVYPNAWTESSLFAAYGNLKDFRMSPASGRLAFPGMGSSVTPEDAPPGASLWDHLVAHGVSFYNFGEGFDLPGAAQQPRMDPLGARFITDMPMIASLRDHTSREYPGFNLSISDQRRADAFIHEMDERFAKSGADLPQFLFIYLPGDSGGAANPDTGHPYKESFVADNDLALGRIVEYLAASKWWNNMTVFVTESTAVGGVDHISANRTLMLVAGPWAKRGYVSHLNTSFPSLLKTIFWLFRLPPLNLFDVSAASLQDCFAAAPDAATFHALPVDTRIFTPEAPGTGQ